MKLGPHPFSGYIAQYFPVDDNQTTCYRIDKDVCGSHIAVAEHKLQRVHADTGAVLQKTFGRKTSRLRAALARHRVLGTDKSLPSTPETASPFPFGHVFADVGDTANVLPTQSLIHGGPCLSQEWLSISRMLLISRLGGGSRLG